MLDFKYGLISAILAAVIGYGLLITSQPIRKIWRWGRRYMAMTIIVSGIITGLMGAGAAWILIKQEEYRASSGAVTGWRLESLWRHPRVSWNFGSFLAMGGYPVGLGGSIALLISGFQAQGTNNSDEPITSISGYLRSNLTNETLPLYMIVDGLPVAPEKTNGIPPRATFGIVIPFGPDSFKSHGMLNEETFLRKFGDFTVVIELDGRREEHRFSNEKILRLISDWKRGVYKSDKPGVTKKN